MIETEHAIYFYKTTGKYGYMSNFYKSKFQEDGIQFVCSEQYFMYYKCLQFEPNNVELQQKILTETSGSKIKRLGRQVQNFDEVIWGKVCMKIMENGIQLKIDQNPTLREKLLATGNKILYEASKNDKKWGIGFNENDAINVSPEKYGKNMLGKALMNVRKNL